MDKIKITREEALRRWNSAKETKRRMVERLEVLARESYKDQTGEYPVEVGTGDRSVSRLLIF